MLRPLLQLLQLRQQLQPLTLLLLLLLQLVLLLLLLLLLLVLLVLQLELLEGLALVHPQVHPVQHAVLQLVPAIAGPHRWKLMRRYYHQLSGQPRQLIAEVVQH